MPSRWWVPLVGIRPQTVKPEHLHAAVTHWFDRERGEHDATTKAYALSPIAVSNHHASVGFEVGTLTTEAEERLLSRGGAGTLQLGQSLCAVGEPQLINVESWSELDTPSGARRWTLHFQTPTTFRRGSRSSPLPAPGSVLQGLQQSWNWCNGAQHRELARGQSEDVWVSHLDAASQTLMISGVTWSGLVGRVTFRCDTAETADVVDGLFRLAAYSGVGSAKAKGLGVTQVAVEGLRPFRGQVS